MPFTSAQRGSWSLAARTLLLAASAALCFIVSASGVGGQTTDDHGNSFATATSLSLGASVAGRIHPVEDTDVFELDLTGESGLTDVWAYTTGEDEDYNTVGGLYDADATLLAFNDDSFLEGGKRGFSLRASVPPGVYYVVVTGYDEEIAEYTLHTQAVSDPGSDAETAKQLILGSPTAGTVDTATDADFFALEFDDPTHVIIQARTANYLPIDAELVDEEGTEISANVYTLTVLVRSLRFRHGFEILDDFGPGTYYIKVTADVGPDSRPIPYTIYAYEDTEYAEYVRECEAETRSLNDPLISDPLYACQWHLESPDRESINVESVWAEGIKGDGVNIAVVDDGMYHTHVDLRDNVDADRNQDYTGQGDIYTPYEHHGTHVAGMIAAKDNDIGVRGVAPEATMYGYNFLAEPSFLDLLDAMTRHADVTAVSNNSWGYRDGIGLGRVSSFWERAVTTGITNGNDGKGTFYVFSAGNGHLLGDYSNLDEYVNYYAVTAVCSVHSGGARAGYSEMGSNLWVCAPSNNRPSFTGAEVGILTTENSDRYLKDFGGTSAAGPIVSGVAALVRGVNPDLTWRDVKLIFASSARKNDPGSSGWQDGAQKYGSDSDADRYHFNHEYGFGVVDARAAVDLAKTWDLLPPLRGAVAESGQVDLEVPDAQGTVDPTMLVSELTIDTDIGFTEFVEVNVDFLHDSFRDLEIELVSPSGAISKLSVPFDSLNDYYDPFIDFVPLYGSLRLGSAKHLGEDPNGVWQLRVTDRIPLADGILEAWSITVYGHERTPGPPVVDSVTPVEAGLDLSWSTPLTTAGLPVTSYDLRHIPTDDDETMDINWTVLNNIWTAELGGDLVYPLSGLSHLTRYDVQVRAVNSWGAGDWSESGSGTAGNALPTFDEGASVTRTIREDAAAGSNVGDPVTATDDQTVTYSLSGADEAFFDIESGTGQITVSAAAALDYETETSHTVVVTATDPHRDFATAMVTIMVTDLDLGPYDVDDNEVIDSGEVLAAVADYFNGLITREEVLRLVELYFSSG